MSRASTKENKNKYQLIPVGLLVAAWFILRDCL